MAGISVQADHNDTAENRSHAATVAYGRFINLVQGSQLGQMLHGMESSALRTAVREKAEDVYAQAQLYKNGASMSIDMLERRTDSLAKILGELLAQEVPVKGGEAYLVGGETCYDAGQRLADEFAEWARQSQPARTR